MRNISFSLTTEQIRDRSKTVTRRLGWTKLKPGTHLRACRKCMGIPKGEHVEELAVIRVDKVTREPLYRIDALDCEREGFPYMHPEQFIAMFCKHMRVTPETEVTRIEFSFIN